MASLWRFVLATRPMKFNKLNFVRHVARTKYPPNWKKKSISSHRETCRYNISLGHVTTTFHMCVILWFCPCYMSPLHVPATCHRYTSLLHVASVCTTQVFVAATYPCKMSVQVDPSCLLTFGSNKGLRCNLPNLVRKLDVPVFAIRKISGNPKIMA